MVVRKIGNNIKEKLNKNKNNVGADPVSAQKNKENTILNSKGENLPYWNNVIDKIKQSGKMGMYVNLIGSTAREINDMIVEVELANKNSFAKNILESHENKAEIERILSMEAGKTMNVRFVSKGDKKEENKKENQIEDMITDLDIPINIIDE